MKTSNKILLAAFIITAVLLFAAMAAMRSMIYQNVVQGDGNVVEQQRGASDFTRVIIRGNFQVYYSQSDNTELTVIADSNLHDHIRTEIKGDELVISTRQPIRSRNDLRINISNPYLTFVEASAAAGFFSSYPLELQNLRLNCNAGARMDVSGNFESLHVTQNAGAKVKLAGTAQNLEVTSNAGGTVDAMELESNFARVEANAGASISVNAAEIEASANAGGSIRYSGDPSFRSMNTNAGGSIRKQN
jgi:hypothetical protein